jgi:hypothetical protein
MRKPTPALRAAAVAGQFHWARLVDALRDLDWQADKVLEAARRIAREAADTFLDVCARQTLHLDLPPATVFRNLAVLAPTTALPMLYLAWRTGSRNSARTTDCDFARWAVFLSHRARRRGVVFPFQRLDGDPPRLSLGDVNLLIPENDARRFRVLMLHTGQPDLRSISGLLRRLLSTLRHCPTPTPMQIATWCRDLWKAEHLPSLPCAAFDRLPWELRRAILTDSPEAHSVRQV